MKEATKVFKQRFKNLNIYFLFIGTKLSRAGFLGLLILFAMFLFALVSGYILPYFGITLSAEFLDEYGNSPKLDAGTVVTLPVIWLFGVFLWGKIKYGHRSQALAVLLHRNDPKTAANLLKNWDKGQYSPGAGLWFFSVIGWLLCGVGIVGALGFLVGLG